MSVSDDPDRAERRRDLGVPDAAASCHTALVGGYVLEGHVPLEAIERMLVDRPDIVGVAVPGMPGDSPGMGGDESTRAKQSVVAIGASGAMSPFDY